MCCCWSLRRLLSVGRTRRGQRLYKAVSEFSFGPQSLHLHLSVSAWAADGLLAIFFFVVGLELKREFVAGDLRDPARAALPIAAAVGGMVVPAAVYIGSIWLRVIPRTSTGGRCRSPPTSRSRSRCSRCCPRTYRRALRTFLLTLAVVDDLLAITVIAIFYTDHLVAGPAGAGADSRSHCSRWPCSAVYGTGGFWCRWPWSAWALVHASGVHATVAGVLLGFTVPVLGRHGRPAAELFEHAMRPVSAGFAVPVFAFFAAGVTVGGWSGLGASLTAPGHRSA